MLFDRFNDAMSLRIGHGPPVLGNVFSIRITRIKCLIQFWNRNEKAFSIDYKFGYNVSRIISSLLSHDSIIRDFEKKERKYSNNNVPVVKRKHVMLLQWERSKGGFSCFCCCWLQILNISVRVGAKSSLSFLGNKWETVKLPGEVVKVFPSRQTVRAHNAFFRKIRN